MYKILLLLCICCTVFVVCGSDTEPPTVAMYFPHDGDTVWATVYITANVHDNEGILNVEFFIDDSMVGTETTIFQDSLYQWMWMTATTGDTTYKSIYTIAHDVNENSATSNTITVYVDNEGHPPGGD